jgi:multiple sugar transport system permease protein
MTATDGLTDKTETTAAAETRPAVRRSNWRRTRTLQGFLYALPTLLFVAVLFVLPLLLVFQISGSNWKLLTGDRGLNLPNNYTSISSDQLFWPAVVFTIEYTILVTVLLIGIGLGLALLVQSSGRWVGVLRTSFLVPGAIGLATASLLFWGFYSPTIGPISPPLQQLGVIKEPIQFFLTTWEALLSAVFLIVWKYAGFYMLILLVGLQQISPELMEAANIDGASRRQAFRYVTLPLLRPSLALALILCITGSLLAFDQFFILTNGQPNNSTVTIVQLIYRDAFVKQNLGTAAAMSVVLLAFLLILNAVQFRGLRGRNA